jgi:hypothetical protein
MQGAQPKSAVFVFHHRDSGLEYLYSENPTTPWNETCFVQKQEPGMEAGETRSVIQLLAICCIGLFAFTAQFIITFHV